MTRVEKPWGWYEVILDEPSYKVKKLYVKAGEMISLQSHKERQEIWAFIDTGFVFQTYEYINELDIDSVAKAYFGIGESDDASWISCKPGSAWCVWPGELHSLMGGPGGTLVIETQLGDCDEDDIVRYLDNYGREVLWRS